ncbi:hypothetical protein BH11ACT4_BH11ACT4_08020 [soil metagenome]
MLPRHAEAVANVAETIRQLGGIASTGELLQRGLPRDWIRMAANYGRVRRIRRGWFACLDVPLEAIEARRVGGRLGCASALAHHGVLAQTDAALHISVPRNSSRLRLDRASREVVVHWCRGEPVGDALAVPVDEAWAQRAHCRALRGGHGVDSL